MPLDPGLQGRTYPPTAPYEVGREKIREFADALGDPNPVYRDPDAAAALGHPDVVAPPTFAIVVSMAADAQLVRDPEAGIDYGRVLHGEQRFAHTRPLRPGDRVTATMTVDTIRSAAGHDLVTTRSEIVTVEGEHVCTATSTLVVRGEDAEKDAERTER